MTGAAPEPARPRRWRTGLRGPGPRVRLAGLALGAASAFLIVWISGVVTPEKLEDWVEGFGWAAPVAFVLGAACLTPLMVPGPLLAGASGLLFGTALGTPVAITSATLGACLAFLIGRFVAGDVVEEIGGPRVKSLARWVGRRGFLSVLYARILPGMPYNAINYAAGLTTVRLVAFAAATAIGTAPRTFAYVALGGSLGDLGSPESVAAIAIIVGMGVTGIVLVRRDLRRERAAAHSAPPPVDAGGADA
jgi:uncharacterized membrane protein YdjX (TVP38/TMEM64 family)